MMRKSYILMALAGVSVFTSCADQDPLAFFYDKPGSLSEYEYLESYDVLKSYVNRSANPGFKLGSAVNAGSYNQKGVVYALTNTNFDEVVTGNAFKYASVVGSGGTMDFTTVKDFIANATTAGLTVYGHTLAWHSQQNKKYLGSLIADKVPPVDPNANRLMKIVLPEPKANPWDWEIYYDLDEPLVKGKTYVLSMRTKATKDYQMPFWPGDGTNTQYLGSIPCGNDLEKQSLTFTASYALNRLRFEMGTFQGSIWIDDVTLVEQGSTANLVKNSTFDSDDISKWTKPSWLNFSYELEGTAATVDVPKVVKAYTFEDGDMASGWGNGSTREIASGSYDGSKCLKVVNPTSANPWEAQTAIDFDEPLDQGTTYYLHFWAKSSVAGDIGAGFQNPSDYSGRGDFPSMALTTDWKEYTVQTTVTGDNCKRLTLNYGAHAGTMYFDDVEIYRMVKSNTIPLTEQEKKDTLTWAMDQWVGGMMRACAGQVKAWDVVNEPISGVDKDGDGFYDLQSATRGTVDASGAANNFYWQDYLGDLYYVRTVVADARKHFAENGGNAADLKLFVNDYNLETAYDQNKKCKSLVEWIRRWEADGVTKIDGIGTQMHVSVNMNAEKQKVQEASVDNMFKLMAATGKLVRVSELDMGIVDENGNEVKTADATEEQLQAQARYFNYIVRSYFRNVPAAQRYSICAWGQTDSPADSGWRAGLPIGLWTEQYTRKHAYAGFAKGLQDQDFVAGE
jgi:endo-1,4-beta-xylanase